MTQLTESDALKLLDDRVKFKLYVAEQELSNLKELEKNGSGMSNSFIDSSITTFSDCKDK